jgi:hypothetical protein
MLIDGLRKRYGIGGAKRHVGDYGNGSARNAIVQYYNFVVDLGKNTIGLPNVGIPEDSTELPDTAISTEDLEPANARFTYERDLHNALERHAAELFPGYQLVGSEYAVGGVRLDFLFEKDQQLLVVELKAGVATHEVFGQISMYIGMIKEEYPDYDVRGIIIAGEISAGLRAACRTNEAVICKTYTMKITLEND